MISVKNLYKDFKKLRVLNSVSVDIKKGEKVAIICDYDGQESYYELETILVVRVFRVLGAVLRAGIDEAKRMAQEDAASQRNSRSAP